MALGAIALADESADGTLTQVAAAIDEHNVELLNELLSAGVDDINGRFQMRLELGREGWDVRSSTLLGAAFTCILSGAPSAACVRVLFAHGSNGDLFETDEMVMEDGTLAYIKFEPVIVASFLDAYEEFVHATAKLELSDAVAQVDVAIEILPFGQLPLSAHALFLA